ncbi:MAG: hypothetical protein R3249_06780 [Nitriliruptorales bacterium]|nr:hypothetical protein [Nitriliruptorales bacterium]
MIAALLENPPPRVVEFIRILDARQVIARLAAGGFLVLGMLVALVAPSVLPRHPLVGAAVGLGAVLVAVAAVLATDANDLIIRGPQHVRAAGSRTAITVAATPSPPTVSRLAALAMGRLEAGARVVSIVPASKSVREIPTWTDLIAGRLAGVGRHVVVVDLTGTWGDIDDLGVTDVARGRCKLSEAVTFDPELTVARLGTGADPHAARESAVGFLARVPKDVDLVLFAMPSLTMAGALTAVGSTDAALVLAEVDVTHRLALIGTLDAIDDVGVDADVILLDRSRNHEVEAPRPPEVPPVATTAPADEIESPPAVEATPAVIELGDSGVPLQHTQPFPVSELLDVEGRGAVRTAAALGSFAEEVWRRGDAE